MLCRIHSKPCLYLTANMSIADIILHLHGKYTPHSKPIIRAGHASNYESEHVLITQPAHTTENWTQRYSRNASSTSDRLQANPCNQPVVIAVASLTDPRGGRNSFAENRRLRGSSPLHAIGLPKSTLGQENEQLRPVLVATNDHTAIIA